jgi:ribosomal-protein-alanine N-acetyltransferase
MVPLCRDEIVNQPHRRGIIRHAQGLATTRAGSMARTHPAKLRISTDRLVLRPVAPSDASATAALVTEDVASSLSTWPYPMTAEQVLQKIHASMESFAKSEALDLAILRAENGRLSGWMGFLAEGKSARLAYWLGQNFRGQGIVTEAAIAAIPVAADFLGVTALHALVLKTNQPSIRVLHRLGFSLLQEELIEIETRNSREPCLRFERQLSNA